jgi:hypothetical protein
MPGTKTHASDPSRKQKKRIIPVGVPTDRPRKQKAIGGTKLETNRFPTYISDGIICNIFF